MTIHPSTDSQQWARIEADRCLRCFDAPCIKACPTHIRIPTFISMIASGNIRGAAEVVKESNAMANVCGSVCPEEIYCQSVCNRANQDTAIEIRGLHLFATQFEARRTFSPLVQFPSNGKRIAVLGGGPTGLSCAFELRKLGYQVTVYDPKGIGGVPRHSIPAFRLADDVLNDDLHFLSGHFAIKRTSVEAADIARFRKKYHAIFVGVGLGQDRSLNIPGERAKGVYPVLQFLESAKSKKFLRIGKRVVVIGGGNVSLDAAATAKRLGAKEVTLVYRRGEQEMKVWKSELEEARKQGVEIRFLTDPREILGGRKVAGVRCVRTKLSGKRDKTGRRIPVEVSGSDFVLKADSVIVAIGQLIRSDVRSLFSQNSGGLIMVDENFRTSMRKIFAGGDAVSGEGTIVQSVAHGKEAALRIHRALMKRSPMKDSRRKDKS